MASGHSAHRGYSYAGRSDYDSYDEFYYEGAHSRSNGSKGKKNNRPPGLKGKQIGLYYRDQSMKKRAENPEAYDAKKRERRTQPKYFSLDTIVAQNLKKLLSKLNTSYAHEELTINSDNNSEIAERYTHIGDSQFKKKFLNIVSGNIQENLVKSMQMKSKLTRDSRLNEQLQEELKVKQTSVTYQNMLEFRAKLPAFKMKDEILNLVNSNQVVVISGETGCGKTTQVAQFILDDAIEKGQGSTTKVVCTQPRRISAISVAERVAAERDETMGKTIGYQIRLEKSMCRDTGSILFCTTGILLQYMQSDPALRDFSHIILDEIHERNTQSDFIITLLKQVIPKRPDVKIILMSATLNADTFSKYYENCPCIHIPGFTYPVIEYYLEDILQMTRFKFPPASRRDYYKDMKNRANDIDEFRDIIKPALRQMEAEKIYPSGVINELKNSNSEELSLDLIQSLLEHISYTKGPGAILVFLPGLMDISNLNKKLLTSGRFPSHKFQIYPLHSRLPTGEQKLIFKKPALGVRKIIIATSIAETSITIEDVIYVVDSGRTKLSRFDANNNIEILKPEWITVANATQRRGRAGRVKPGECYRLFTRARQMTFDEFPTPEMLRTPLEQVILQAKVLQLGRIDVFLGSVMDPPEDKAIKLSIELLRTLNAIDSKENLTPLGYHLTHLPLDPRTGKMILWAAMFSCVEPVFAIAASLSFKDAFYCPLGKEDEANKAKLELGLGESSDHIALAEALRRYELAQSHGQAGRFCSEHFLSWNTLKLLKDMKVQFARHLYEMKFLDSDDPSDPRANRNSHNLDVVKAIVCAGLYPNVAVIAKQGKFPVLQTVEDGRVKFHPGSINARARDLPTSYVTFFLKQKSTSIFVHDTTCVNEAALIFAAPKSSIRPQGQRSQIFLNKDLSFLCTHSTAEMIQRLREEMDKLLEHKINHPGTIQWESSEGDVLRAIIEFLSDSQHQSNIQIPRIPPPR